MNKLVVLGATLMFVLSAQAGLYRWVDDAGNVHFSDKVPVAASKKSHTKLNKAGSVTKTVNPESVQREIDSLEQAAKEKKRLDEIERVKHEANEVIQKRDDYLLSTYENKHELINSFESKIKMIEGNTRILKTQNNILDKKIVKLENKVKSTTNNDTVKSMANKINSINRTINQYTQALIENNKTNSNP